MRTHETSLWLRTWTKRDVDIYLLPEVKKLPVPKLVWVVVATGTNKGVSFHFLNDPAVAKIEFTTNAPCQSKCYQMSWISNLLEVDSYEKPINGYVLCCEFGNFMKKVPKMPSLEGQCYLLTGGSVAVRRRVKESYVRMKHSFWMK